MLQGRINRTGSSFASHRNCWPQEFTMPGPSMGMRSRTAGNSPLSWFALQRSAFKRRKSKRIRGIELELLPARHLPKMENGGSIDLQRWNDESHGLFSTPIYGMFLSTLIRGQHLYTFDLLLQGYCHFNMDIPD